MRGSADLIIGQLLKGFEDTLRLIVREEVAAALKASQTIESYTQKEAAQLLKISEPTLIERRKRGEIRAYESGRNVMYTAAEINRYRENNKI